MTEDDNFHASYLSPGAVRISDTLPASRLCGELSSPPLPMQLSLVVQKSGCVFVSVCCGNVCKLLLAAWRTLPMRCEHSVLDDRPGVPITLSVVSISLLRSLSLQFMGEGSCTCQSRPVTE